MTYNGHFIIGEVMFVNKYAHEFRAEHARFV